MARSLASPIVAILGATGAGKSSFVQTLTGQNVPLSHGLESSTTSILPYTISLSDETGRTMTVLDTPGLDGEDMSDVEIMQNILTFINENYGSETSLSGIIYLHRITDARVGGQASRALNTFRTLTGSASFGQVVLMTTMWDLVDPSIGEKREAALRNTYWRPLIARGARMERFSNTRDSAFDVVRPIGGPGPAPGPNSSPPLGLSRGSGTPASSASRGQPQKADFPSEKKAKERRQWRPRRFRRISKVAYQHIQSLLGPATGVATAVIGWTEVFCDWVFVEASDFPAATKRASSATRLFMATTKGFLLIHWRGLQPVPFP